jgi:DNA-binding transcriptional LysR family regulator
LRTHFDDPLFIRVGSAMKPTPKAERLEQPLTEMLLAVQSMQSSTEDFDPKSSDREFKILTTDIGMIRFLPPLLQKLADEGQNLRLRAIPLDTREFSAQLESGEADIALGSFSQASGNTRHQRLYADNFVSIARKDHPRFEELTKRRNFLKERHVIVAATTTGHAAHMMVQRALETELHPNRILMRVPSFMPVGFIVSNSDAIGTVPAVLANYISENLNLGVFQPPLTLPRLDISQFWHERLHRDPAHCWLRARIFELFGPQSRRA